MRVCFDGFFEIYFVLLLFWVFIGIIGGTPDKRIVFFEFGVFIGIIGGTPDKRISEGLFCPLCFFFWFL